MLDFRRKTAGHVRAALLKADGSEIVCQRFLFDKRQLSALDGETGARGTRAQKSRKLAA